jgi:hypothetical protein
VLSLVYACHSTMLVRCGAAPACCRAPAAGPVAACAAASLPGATSQVFYRALKWLGPYELSTCFVIWSTGVLPDELYFNVHSVPGVQSVCTSGHWLQHRLGSSASTHGALMRVRSSGAPRAQEHVRQRAQLVVFNLGYLPGAGRDRAIMTQVHPREWVNVCVTVCC